MPYLILAAGLALGAFLGWLVLRRKGAEPPPEEALGSLLERSAIGSLLVKDRTIQWANARCAEILGSDATTLRGSGTRTFHQNDAAYDRFGQDVRDACARGTRFQGDVHLRRVDGSPFWAYLTGGLLLESRPEEGMLWFMEDVTERVEAQTDLSEALALNQKLIAASPTGLMLYRVVDGACILVNEAAARMANGTKEGLLRQNFRRVKTWKEAGLRDAADLALATGEEQHLDSHFVTSFGREVWVKALFIPLLSRGERLLLLLVDDVSEKVKTSSALRISEEKYRVVVDALNEGLALVDTSGCFTFCNRRLMEMGGYAPEEILGKHYSAFVRGGDMPLLMEKSLLKEAVSAETFELGLARRDGSFMESRVSVASVVDGAGAVSALAILATDISLDKMAQRERELLVGELEQKNKELETLLYVASHDLRSPLVNIQGFSQRLAKSLQEIGAHQAAAGSLEEFRAAIAPHVQERMPASLEFIRASGAKMDAIINGLLTLSRAGRMVLRAEPLDMNALVRTCSATLAFQFQTVAGSLQVEDLPPCEADPVQVTQILSNLLDNAIKYRSRDRSLKVRVSGRVSGKICEYCVEDNGVGIAPEHRERIWEIFQRLDPQGPIEGDGLGLTLVRRMAERNGGGIRVESAPEAGCRFYLELPR